MAYTTINKSTEHFNTKLYNGTGSSNSITGVGFEPSFTWIKRRNSATNHHLHNAVSGATKVLYSNSTAAESTDAQKLYSFDSDGFTVGTNGDANNSSGTFVSWNWKAGGGQGSSNTDGSINTIYTSVNTTAGFSISTYTGNGTNNQTVGHGLGATPSMVIIKDRDNGNKAWVCYHSALGATKAIFLEQTAQANTSNSYFVNTAPTNSLFTIGDSSHVNNNGDKYIAYCFAEKTGYSKFGSYTGNGSSTDGTFVYTGFKPAFIMGKYTGGTGDWYLWDNKRLGYNPDNNKLKPNTNDAETTENWIEMYSNGFKFFNNSGDFNYSGYNFIYMAFAEAPLVGSNNVPATAR
jgi:hypothetical protein